MKNVLVLLLLPKVARQSESDLLNYHFDWAFYTVPSKHTEQYYFLFTVFLNIFHIIVLYNYFSNIYD